MSGSGGDHVTARWQTVARHRARPGSCDDKRAMAETQLTHMVSGVSPVTEPPADGVPTPGANTPSGLNRRTLVQGTVGSIAILIGSLGAGGDLIQDPILGTSPL